jgi:hypothetical protein
MTTATPGKNEDILTLTAEALELELRRMTANELIDQVVALDAVDRDPLLTPAGREQGGLWRQLAAAVYYGRDTTLIAQEWDRAATRVRRAENGRPEGWRTHQNVSALREAGDRPLGPSARLRWEVSVHEAAHAVIADALGAQIERINVFRSPASGPIAVTLREGGLTADERVMLRVAAHEALKLAGIEPGYGTRTDLRQAHEIARDACGGDEKQAASKVKELSAKVAKLLVTDPLAQQLRAVAQALQTELMLDADAFRALMKP